MTRSDLPNGKRDNPGTRAVPALTSNSVYTHELGYPPLHDPATGPVTRPSRFRTLCEAEVEAD
jgi:hypothetical protein